MSQVQIVDRQRRFLPSLEGIRGYGFLLIFAGHYFEFGFYHIQHTWWLYPLFLIGQVAWVMVPGFFVLSGYLICGILFHTRERSGYFKVFYTRRILRVFPIYYLTLLAVAGIDSLKGVPLNSQFWWHFLYIHNLFPSYRDGQGWSPAGQVIHLWSMAVEEQFYLAWPLVVWFCRERRTLLRITWLMIAASCALRFAVPLLHISPLFTFYWTPTRADAILLGAVLALIDDDTVKWMERYAKYVALAGTGGLMLIAGLTGEASPVDYLRCALLIPLGNITAVAYVVAVREEGSVMCRVCSMKWICWVGGRSYSMYLFHLTYAAWFFAVIRPWLGNYIPHALAFLVTVALGLGLTLLLGIVSYQFVEGPVMKLKGRMKYGSDRPSEAQREVRVHRLAESDS